MMTDLYPLRDAIVSHPKLGEDEKKALVRQLAKLQENDERLRKMIWAANDRLLPLLDRPCHNHDCHDHAWWDEECNHMACTHTGKTMPSLDRPREASQDRPNWSYHGVGTSEIDETGTHLHYTQKDSGTVINDKVKRSFDLVQAAHTAERAGDQEEAELLYSQARQIWQ